MVSYDALCIRTTPTTAILQVCQGHTHVAPCRTTRINATDVGGASANMPAAKLQPIPATFACVCARAMGGPPKELYLLGQVCICGRARKDHDEARNVTNLIAL